MVCGDGEFSSVNEMLNAGVGHVECFVYRRTT